jgi:4'-phosphopantetheinyl transferase
MQDRTPVGACDEARVLYVPFSPDADVASVCRQILSNDELEQTELFVNAGDASRFIQRRAFRRYCGAIALGMQRSLKEIHFAETDKRRPFLANRADIWFSFSSCKSGFVGAWSLTHGVGVDIEDKSGTIVPEELAGLYFSESEIAAIETASGSKRLDIFLMLWCLKEAALKSIGEGIPFGLDAFEFELTPEPRVTNAPSEMGGPEDLTAHLIEIDDHYVSLITRRY